MGLRRDVDQLLTGRPPRIDRPPVTARVVKTEGGVFAAPLDTDPNKPIGPCRGPASVAVGDVVLLIWTNEQPWVAQVDGGG